MKNILSDIIENVFKIKSNIFLLFGLLLGFESLFFVVPMVNRFINSTHEMLIGVSILVMYMSFCVFIINKKLKIKETN